MNTSIKGIEVELHELSYDKIIKNTLTDSDEMTVRFINGLFGDKIPINAPVDWLDKESVSRKRDGKHRGIVANFYPRVAGKMYEIEIEQDSRSGDMAIRVFKYALGGAILHGTSSTKTEMSITFPQPCVIFLKSTRSTPKELTWNIEFYDGQKVTLKVPTVRLKKLSVKEIADRDLFPIGQFYLRTFEKLTKSKLPKFLEAAAELIREVKNALDQGRVPYNVAVQMQETISKTLDNVLAKSGMEVDEAMTTNIRETLPWVDYAEVFRKLEAQGLAEGLAEGEAQGKAQSDAQWQSIVADKDAEIARLKAQLKPK